MVETFGDAWKTARAEEFILCRGGPRKVSVQWTNLEGEPVYEYGYQHKMFRASDEDSAENPPQNARKLEYLENLMERSTRNNWMLEK